VGKSEVYFASLRDPIYRGGNVAFSARLNGSGVTLANAEALFAGAPGALRMVARTGQLAPEAGGAVFVGFPALTLFHENRQRALWLATLAGKGVNRTNDRGLWAENSVGARRLLLRKGGPLLGRTVKTFSALPSVADSPDAPRTANAAGEAVVLVDFTDATQAVVKLTIP
jgi:hypothetical protein